MASQAGFVAFIRDVMGINTTALPDASPTIPLAYDVAIETVNLQIGVISTLYYDLAVYNLAGDFLLNWANDTTPSTFFTDYRRENNLNGFVAGVVASSADETTSNSLLVPDFFKYLSLSDLQQLQTPFGRAYLAIAQKFWPVWGIS